MARARGQANTLQFCPGAPKWVVQPGQFHRHRHIFQRRHGRQQVKCLQDDANPAPPGAGQRIFIALTKINAINDNLTTACTL